MPIKTVGSLLLLVVAQMSTAQDLEQIAAGLPTNFQLPVKGNSILRDGYNRILEAPPTGASPDPSLIASLFPRQAEGEVEEDAPLVKGKSAAGRPVTTLWEHIDKIKEDPLRHFGAIAEGISSRFRQRAGTGSIAADTSPFNFLRHLENLQKLIDDFAGNETCSPIFGTIDQTMYSMQQALQSLQALNRLRSSWLSITPETILTCFAMPKLKTIEDVI